VWLVMLSFLLLLLLCWSCGEKKNKGHILKLLLMALGWTVADFGLREEGNGSMDLFGLVENRV